MNQGLRLTLGGNAICLDGRPVARLVPDITATEREALELLIKALADLEVRQFEERRDGVLRLCHAMPVEVDDPRISKKYAKSGEYREQEIARTGKTNA